VLSLAQDLVKDSLASQLWNECRQTESLRGHGLEAVCSHTFLRLLDEGFVELENDGDSHQNTSTTANRTHKVSHDGEGPDAHSSKGSGGWDVTVQDMDQSRVTVSLHNHLLITQLLGDITGRRSGDFNPCLGEEGARRQNKDQVKDSVKRIVKNLCQRSRRRDVVGNSSHGNFLAGRPIHFLPLAEQTNENVGRRTIVQELRHKVEVGDQRTHQNDGHVRSIEELDRIVAFLSTVLLVLDRQVHTPSLEVNDQDKDKHGGQKVGQVGQVLAVEGFLEGLDFVVTSDQEMEQSNDRSLELGTTASVDGSGGKRLPDDRLANVGSDKERDTASETVALGKKLVESQDNETSTEELGNDQDGVTCTKCRDGFVCEPTAIRIMSQFRHGRKQEHVPAPMLPISPYIPDTT
jgi:hypothetical protein